MDKPKKPTELNQAQLDKILSDNGKAVLMPSEFQSLLKECIHPNMRLKDAEAILEQRGSIARVTLRSDDYKDVNRIAVLALHPTPYDYAMSLRSGAYLSHASAVHLLGLTEQQPRYVYVNKEQSEKPRPVGELTQEAIDRAFARPQRRSKYEFRIKETRIVLLSGKATGNAGVIYDHDNGLLMTGLERTLLDITVRPRYAGGVFQVLNAFRASVDEINHRELLNLLSVVDYKYPYHQALGFYLEKAGAKHQILDSFRDLGLQFDFYLDYAMASPGYDESWCVYYPLGV